MNLTAHEPSLAALDGLTGYESVCVFIAQDERPLKGLAGYMDWRLCGALSRVLVQEFFVGAPGDKLLLPTEGKFPMERMFAVGIGHASQLTGVTMGEILTECARMLGRANAEGVVLEVPGAGTLPDSIRAEAFSKHFLSEFKGSKIAVLGEKPIRALLTKS